MIELVRRRMMMGGSALPYDAEVEWLESTGTQYIDTGIIANSDISMESCFAITATPFFFVQGMSLNQNCAIVVIGQYYNESTLSAVFATGNREGASIPFDYEYHTYYVSRHYQKVDNVTSYITSGDTLGCSPISGVCRQLISIYLFARNIDWSAEWNKGYMKCRKKYDKIWYRNILIADYIPVRKNGVGYMYDKVSGQLFGNQGTGQFIIGPDK